MTEETIPAGHFKAKYLKLLDEVNEGHCTLIITKHGKPMARLLPPLKKKKNKGIKAGFMKGSVIYQGDIISPMTELWNLPE